MSAHKESALTTTTTPAYEIVKHGGGGRHKYELGGSAETDPPTVDVTYEMIPSPPSHQPPSHQPPSHQPLSTVPLSVAPGVVGVASGGGEEGVYDVIPDN